EGRGPLLEDFVRQGEGYWDSPVVNQPPGFFVMLLASHALLGRSEDGFPLAARDPRAVAAWRSEFFAQNGQFYERRVNEIAKLPAASALTLGLEAFVASRSEPEARRSLRLAALVGAACAVAMAIKVSAVFLLPAIAFGRWMRGDAGRSLAVLLAVALVPTLP